MAMSTTYTMPDTGLIPVAFRFDRCVPVLAPIYSLSLRPEHTFVHTAPTLHQSVAQNLRRIHRDVIVYIFAH